MINMDIKARKRRYIRNFGLSLKRQRRARKLSQEDVAAAMGLHQSAYCRIETGDRIMDVFEHLVFCRYVYKHPIIRPKYLTEKA